MTQEAIQKQIEIIRQATAKATKTKESARQFLIDAGIIQEGKKPKVKAKGK